jgi:hypothetical protein
MKKRERKLERNEKAHLEEENENNMDVVEGQFKAGSI